VGKGERAPSQPRSGPNLRSVHPVDSTGCFECTSVNTDLCDRVVECSTLTPEEDGSNLIFAIFFNTSLRPLVIQED
jgi:hypothetical protein